MWSRVVEIMLGCWLLISPFIFSHPDERTAWWINDMACGTLAIAFGLLSFWRPTRQAHLATILLALWLIGFAYSHLGMFEEHAPYAVQNQVLLGWLLLMFAVIPNYATRPPSAYDRQFHELVGR